MLRSIGVFDLHVATTVAGVRCRQMEVYCVALVVTPILTPRGEPPARALWQLGAGAATLPSSNWAQDEENHHGRYRYYRHLAWPPHRPMSRLSASRAAQQLARLRCRGIDLSVNPAASLLPLSAPGLGQVDLPALPQPARDRTTGHIWFHGQGPYGRALQH